jgi:integrase
MSTRSRTKGVYFREGIAYIRYQDERGSDIRESTKQRSAKVAEGILSKRKTEVAMRQHFPSRAFDAIAFTDLADYWWQAHGSKTRSQFEYLYPRVLEYFASKRARDITPDVVDAFLEHLATERRLSASSVNHHRTIVNGIFNFAVKRGRFDRNPVAAVLQRPEPPGRDRIVSPAEFRILWDRAEGDREMERSSHLRVRRQCGKARSCRSGGNTFILGTRRTRRWSGRRRAISATSRFLRAS